jgi:hypothetical protein
MKVLLLELCVGGKQRGDQGKRGMLGTASIVCNRVTRSKLLWWGAQGTVLCVTGYWKRLWERGAVKTLVGVMSGVNRMGGREKLVQPLSTHSSGVT